MFIQYCLFKTKLAYFQVRYLCVPGVHQFYPSVGIRRMKDYPCKTSVTVAAGRVAQLRRERASTWIRS